MNPETRRRSHEKAAALVQDGRLDEAVELYRQLQAEDWRDLRALAALRDLFRKLGRESDLADQFAILARYHQEAGRESEAVELLVKAVALDPERPVLYLALAEGLLRAGAVERARLAFFEAASRFVRAGQADEARSAVQRSFEGCGDPYSALKNYLEAAQHDPEHRARIELHHLYRCLGWSSDLADEHVVRVLQALARHGVAEALQLYVGSLKAGARPEQFGPDFHLEVAAWLRRSNPAAADRHLRHAEAALRVRRTIH